MKKTWALDKRFTPKSTPEEREREAREWEGFVRKARALYAAD